MNDVLPMSAFAFGFGLGFGFVVAAVFMVAVVEVYKANQRRKAGKAEGPGK